MNAFETEMYFSKTLTESEMCADTVKLQYYSVWVCAQWPVAFLLNKTFVGGYNKFEWDASEHSMDVKKL